MEIRGRRALRPSVSLAVPPPDLLVFGVRPLGFEPRTCGLRVRFRLSHASHQCPDALFCLRFGLPSLLCLRGSGELRGDDTRYANACNRERRRITSPKVPLRVLCRRMAEHVASVSPVTGRLTRDRASRGASLWWRSVSMVSCGDELGISRCAQSFGMRANRGPTDPGSASVCLTRLSSGDGESLIGGAECARTVGGVAVERVERNPELDAVVARVRRHAAETGELGRYRSGRYRSQVPPEVADAVLELLRDGTYAAAVASIVADDPDLGGD